jgi:hypothetical protein
MDPKYFRQSGAEYSECETYRYRLWRKWEEGPTVTFLMLNPSTADAYKNDPTIERCHRRAVAMGFAALEIVNIFAYRATDPRELKKAANPIGPDNDANILESARKSDMTICAWGSHGDHKNRHQEVKELLKSHDISAHVLGLTAKGQPRHPLYLPYSRLPRQWAEL